MTEKVKNQGGNPMFQAGEAVPELTLLDENGQKVTLSSLWRQGPVLLAMIRHYG